MKIDVQIIKEIDNVRHLGYGAVAVRGKAQYENVLVATRRAFGDMTLLSFGAYTGLSRVGTISLFVEITEPHGRPGKSFEPCVE